MIFLLVVNRSILIRFTFGRKLANQRKFIKEDPAWNDIRPQEYSKERNNTFICRNDPSIK